MQEMSAARAKTPVVIERQKNYTHQVHYVKKYTKFQKLTWCEHMLAVIVVRNMPIANPTPGPTLGTGIPAILAASRCSLKVMIC